MKPERRAEFVRAEQRGRACPEQRGRARKQKRRPAAPRLLAAVLLFATLAFLAKLIFTAKNTSDNAGASAGDAGPATVQVMPTDVPAEVPGTPECGDTRAAWNLVLVNAQNPLAADPTPTLLSLREGQAVDERIYPQLQAMMDACRAEGLAPLICSSYRTAQKQAELHEATVQRYLAEGMDAAAAEAEATRWSAVPGTSEHQTGLAVDIVAESYQLLDKAQEETPEQQWLMQNAWKYGFILRYPTNKSDLTGIGYEPWHYRYVGTKAAEAMHRSGLCFEEYAVGLSA